MSETSANIISKVRKLMAVTVEAGATEAEAMNAASLIQGILGAHNLSLAQVAASNEGTAAKDAPAPRQKAEHNRAAMYLYQRSLMETLAKNGFCMHFIHEVQAESNGKMRTVIDRRYPLEESGAALEYIGSQRARGKVIVTLD